MTAQPLELPSAMAGLVGHWVGEGVGGSPVLTADFRFGQELIVEPSGDGVLMYRSRSWALDEPPESDAIVQAPRFVMLESGSFRYVPETGTVEQIVATARGLAMTFVGAIRTDLPGGTEPGAHLEVISDVIGRSASASIDLATAVTAEKRLYSRRGTVLLYAIDQAIEGFEMMPRASAALHPADGSDGAALARDA